MRFWFKRKVQSSLARAEPSDFEKMNYFVTLSVLHPNIICEELVSYFAQGGRCRDYKIGNADLRVLQHMIELRCASQARVGQKNRVIELIIRQTRLESLEYHPDAAPVSREDHPGKITLVRENDSTSSEKTLRL